MAEVNGDSPLARRVLRLALRPVLGSVTGAVTDERVMALTYDDGPDPGQTPAVIDTLGRYRASATFFVLSHKAAAFPELVREVQEAGHEIGLHGRTHRSLIESSSTEVVDMVRGARSQLESVLGQPVRYFRPPYGHQSLVSYSLAWLSGLDVVCWNVSGRDWSGLDRDAVVSRSLEALVPGGILVLHDGYEDSASESEPGLGLDKAELTARLVEGAGERGWRFVSVGELLEGRRADRRMWIHSLR